MSQELIGKKLTIKIKATGQEVRAYKHGVENKFILCEDCRTEFKPEEVIIIKVE